MSDRVGGFTHKVSATPTIVPAAYATGDLIGDKLTFTEAARAGSDSLRPGTGIIVSAVLADLAKQNAAIDLVLFDADPTGTTFTDNAALDVADADLTKIVAVLSFTASVYKDFSDNSVAVLDGFSVAFDLGAAQNLYGAIVSRGAPTYTSAADLVATLLVLQD